MLENVIHSLHPEIKRFRDLAGRTAIGYKNIQRYPRRISRAYDWGKSTHLSEQETFGNQLREKHAVMHIPGTETTQLVWSNDS